MIPTRYQVLNEVYGDYGDFLLLRDAPSLSGSVVELGEHEMCIMRLVSIIPNLSLESLPDGEDPPPRTNSIYGHFQGRETTFLLSQSSWSQATQDC